MTTRTATREDVPVRNGVGETPEPGRDSRLDIETDFMVEESRGRKTGRWVASVIWAPKGAPTALRVRLAERPNGVLELDRGERRGGGRSSTFTTDRQEAVDIAVAELRKIVRNRLDERDIDAEVVEAGGDLTLWQAKQKVLQLQKTRVGAAHFEHIERLFDVAMALKGTDWSVLLIDETFVDLWMTARTTQAIRFPEHLERPNASLAPCSKYTAAKELHALAAQVRMLSNTRRAPGEKATALSFCPFHSPTVLDRMPDPASLMGPPKRPLHTHHLVALLSEWTDTDGIVHPAAVDSVDPSGQLRFTIAIMYDQARRRESVTMLRVRNIALTQAEVRAILARINGPVGEEWAPYFRNGIIEWEGEQDKQGYHRIYPISDFVSAELRVYEDRARLSARHPDDWLFPSSTDPQSPIPWKTLYNTPEPRKAVPDERYADASGTVRTAEGGEVCYDPSGEVRYARRGGRYQRAVALLRHRQRANGGPAELFPVHEGEVVHGWRDGWAVRAHELGYGRMVSIGDQTEIDLDQNADYLGNWAVGGTVKHERYVSLHPVVLMGITESRNSHIIVEEIASLRAKETRRGIEALAQLRSLHHGNNGARDES